MIEVNASTKRGQQLLASARTNIGFHVADVYKKPSTAKKAAWNQCYKRYQNSFMGKNFHVCGHNSMTFSVSWEYIECGESVVVYETAYNTYLIWLWR